VHEARIETRYGFNRPFARSELSFRLEVFGDARVAGSMQSSRAAVSSVVATGLAAEVAGLV
jgi:hypothetical protein